MWLLWVVVDVNHFDMHYSISSNPLGKTGSAILSLVEKIPGLETIVYVLIVEATVNAYIHHKP